MEAATATMKTEVYEARSSSELGRRRSLASVAQEEQKSVVAVAASAFAPSGNEQRSAATFAKRLSARKVSQVGTILEGQRDTLAITGDDAVERAAATAHFSATSSERAIAAKQLDELRRQFERQQQQMQEEMQAQVRAAIEEAQQSKKKMVTSSMRGFKDQTVLGNRLQAAQVEGVRADARGYNALQLAEAAGKTAAAAEAKAKAAEDALALAEEEAARLLSKVNAVSLVPKAVAAEAAKRRGISSGREAAKRG